MLKTKCPKMVGVVILILIEPPFLCSISRGEANYEVFFKFLCVVQAKDIRGPRHVTKRTQNICEYNGGETILQEICATKSFNKIWSSSAKYCKSIVKVTRKTLAKRNRIK